MSWNQVLNCQYCNQCLKYHKSQVENKSQKKLSSKNCHQNLSSKIVIKIVIKIGIKNCHQILSSKIVIKSCLQKLSSKSLIKCLKGHKSQRSPCSVVKTLIVSGVRPRDGQWVLLSCWGQLKNVKNCQKLSKLSKIVKIVKNCQKNCQQIVKMLVRSCFLITLIKCLKGHKSLGSLCNVKSKSTVSQWVTELVSDKVTYWAVVDS